jgi:hypothetical protein
MLVLLDNAIDAAQVITQHTPNQRNVTLHYWLKYRAHVHVWIMRPNQD